ncbi:MAG: AI-2E family transporter [Pseudomonadota bacterium]|nr:AI-2E family transporter [Pseudomonadota bacterium]
MNTITSDKTRPTPVNVKQFTPTKVLVLVAIGVLLWVAHVAFVPIALALLFALILSAPVEALHKLHVPRSLSAAILLVVVLGILAGVGDFMWAPVQHWFKSAPQTVQTVKRKLAPASKFFGHIQALRDNATIMGNNAARPAALPPPAPVADESAPALIFNATRDAAISTMTFVIITLFLLAGGPPMLARMTSAFIDDTNSAHVLDVIEKVRHEVGRFYVTTACINIALGFATAGAMMLCGMPTPYVWGITAAVLNFIPYAGPATTLILVTLAAAVSFDTIGHVAAVTGSFLVLTTLEGQLIQPFFVGRRLEVNPLLVFLALWFGGLFWGIPGIILATPALVALKVVAENAINGRAVMEFLGPNDQRPERTRPFHKKLRPMRQDTSA